MKTAVEFYREELNALVSFKESKFKTEQEIFEQAKAMEEVERQKKQNQFVLNMPFNIEPLTREIGTISDGFSQTEIKNVGYVIKDAKGVEYFFYEKDGELVYDGWCAGFP